MFTAAQARELIPHLVSASIGASPKNFPKILSVNAVRAEWRLNESIRNISHY